MRSTWLLRCVAVGLASALVLTPTSSMAWDPAGLAITPTWDAARGAVVRYELPLDGSVVRPFDEPASAYGSGHRGVDIAAPVGAVIRAAGDGIVSYAGTIAETEWVAVAHPDGTVTSYGPMHGLAVRRGESVGRGSRLGTLSAGGHGSERDVPGLHWGARRGGRYIDPLGLLDEGVARPSLIGPGVWRGAAHVVRPYEPWTGGQLGGWRYGTSPTADRQGFAVPPNPNHLVVVPGLSSSSDTVVLDPQHLGYDPRSVTRFSYAGRAEASGAADDALRDQLPYGPEDTWSGVEVAALRLRDQLRAQAAREPGRAVDLIGHSMGGVVIMWYLAQHHDPYDRSLPPIGHVVTFASPHGGSDLAAVAGDVLSHSVAGPIVESGQDLIARSDTELGRRTGSLPLDAPALRDLRPGSPLLRDLAAGIEQAVREGPSGRFAMGTRVLMIGGGGDQVVGTYRSRILGGGPDGSPLDHLVLPGGHRRVTETEAAREVAWRFLAGEEVVSSPGRLAHLTSRIGGATLRLTGLLVRIHDVAWAPLRRAARPTTTVPRP